MDPSYGQLRAPTTGDEQWSDVIAIGNKANHFMVKCMYVFEMDIECSHVLIVPCGISVSATARDSKPSLALLRLQLYSTTVLVRVGEPRSNQRFILFAFLFRESAVLRILIFM